MDALFLSSVQNVLALAPRRAQRACGPAFLGPNDGQHERALRRAADEQAAFAAIATRREAHVASAVAVAVAAARRLAARAVATPDALHRA
jgi:hypothetical protein